MCWRKNSPARTSFWCSTGRPITVAAHLRFRAETSPPFLPPDAPELNPQENIWDEIREKIFKNYALKSMDAVHAKLEQAILHVKSNPMTVKSITSFPYITRSF